MAERATVKQALDHRPRGLGPDHGVDVAHEPHRGGEPEALGQLVDVLLQLPLHGAQLVVRPVEVEHRGADLVHRVVEGRTPHAAGRR